MQKFVFLCKVKVLQFLYFDGHDLIPKYYKNLLWKGQQQNGSLGKLGKSLGKGQKRKCVSEMDIQIDDSDGMNITNLNSTTTRIKLIFLGK